jgi:hypothetical protein
MTFPLENRFSGSVLRSKVDRNTGVFDTAKGQNSSHP